MEPAIKARDLTFDIPPDLPRYWHGGRRAVTMFFNNLSVFFPQGERFFIASVKAHAAHAQEPALAEAVRVFCQQEGYHSREHVRYNAALLAQGYPVEAMDARISRILRYVRRRLPRRAQLAATCALEHFTALMAHLLLRDPRLLDGAHPTMAALWRWHAAEENEHKAVAFDLYRAAGGGYVERVVIMLLATLIFWAKVLEHQVRLMAADRLLTSLREWAALGKFLFLSPGFMPQLSRLYLSYFRPRFHPWELDNRDLLVAWQKGLP